MQRSQRSNADVLDEMQALSSVGGDREFLEELWGLALAAWPSLMGDIREGMASGDLAGVRRAARLTKAAARNISAMRAYECALHLEEVTARGDLQAVRAATLRLQEEVEILQSVMPAFILAECPA